MKHLLRPYRRVEIVVARGSARDGCHPVRAAAQSTQILELLQGTSPLLHSSSQGYLGVWVDDIDNDKAQALKLKKCAERDYAHRPRRSGRADRAARERRRAATERAKRRGRGATAAHVERDSAGSQSDLEFSRDGNVQTTSVSWWTTARWRTMCGTSWARTATQVPRRRQWSAAGGGGRAAAGHVPHADLRQQLNVGALVEPIDGTDGDTSAFKNGLMLSRSRRKRSRHSGTEGFDVILKVAPTPLRRSPIGTARCARTRASQCR